METQKKVLYHALMEKYMSLLGIMRRNQKNKQKYLSWLLIGIHSISAGQAVKISQISTKLEITNAAATQMVDMLERKEFVERVYDESDHRVTLVRLTSKGKIFLETSFNETAAYIDGLTQYLGEEDTQALLRILDKTIEYVSASDKT